MPINFPTGATTNQVYTYNNLQWQWNGSSWISYTPTIGVINAATGGTYSNGTISLSGTGTLGTITGLVSSAATGGTYSAGTITLSGFGTLTTITGIPTGSTGGAGITWNVAVSPLTAATNNGYIITGATTISLPSTAAVGSIIEIVGASSGLWQISQLAQHQIRFGNQLTTSGVTGVLSATTQGDCVKLVCTTAHNNYIVASAVGNLYFN